MDPDVIDNKAEQRYELRAGEDMAVLAYEMEDNDRIVMVHTEVPEALGGTGVGGRIVRAALDDARDRNLEVVPLCPFVTAYIARHQEYLDLVEPGERARVLAANA